jgi:hypothetical protein
MLSDDDRAAGKAVPDVPASAGALNRWLIKTHTRLVYLPGEAAEFVMNGVSVVNSYRDNLVPPVPEHLSKRDKVNLDLVQFHLRSLLPNDRERALFVSWLAYQVQTNQRVNWAVLIQGTEGDGKTFFSVFMAAILGGPNVKPVSTKTLESGFNNWSQGAQLAVIEEVKLHGHNRHDVLNAMKPLITNSTIEVHAKRENPFEAPNTQSYLLFTNYADALPIGDSDRRYFVLRSRFQTREAVEAFNREHPRHFDLLFEAVNESAGALRGWMLGYELHEDFYAKGRAPWSAGRDYMASMAVSSENEAVAVALQESRRWDVRKDMLDQESLGAEIENLTGEYLTGWRLRRILSEQGWTYRGRFSVKGVMRRLWTQTPEKYALDDGTAGWDRAKVGERIDTDF